MKKPYIYTNIDSPGRDCVLITYLNFNGLFQDNLFWVGQYLFLIGIHSMQGSTVTTRHGVTRKRSTKRLKHTGNPFRKNLQLKDICLF